MAKPRKGILFFYAYTRYNKAMQKKPKPATKPLFKPQDRYFINEQGWWFYTVERIGGPYPSKPECVDACRRYIQKREGLI